MEQRENLILSLAGAMGVNTDKKIYDRISFNSNTGTITHGNTVYSKAMINDAKTFFNSRSSKMESLGDASALFYEIACAAIGMIETTASE